jgi:dihydroxy-acid dehydratase
MVDQAEIERRLAERPASAPRPTRGYAQLYQREVLQADQGCDFNFLRRHPV